MRLRVLAWMLALIALVPVTDAVADPGPALSVDVAAGRHAISPYIYGWNFAPASLAAQIDLPVDRRGGNAADTLNWRNGIENHSNDFFFENIPACWSSCPDPWATHRAYTDQIDADRTVGAKTLLDVPMLGYVPKDQAQPYSQPLPCSFTKANFATQDAFDVPYDPNCGNGKNGNAWVTNVAQTATAVADTAADEGPWIDDLKSRYGDAANGGVAFYELGNEPGLWDSTHHDWHPAPVNYDELWSKSQALASEIKSRDPSASVLGFSEWGWPNYFCSAADGAPAVLCTSASPDRANHGGKPIVEWLLKQFKDWADTHSGQRLLDYLDVHYYRQDGGADGLAATRSLWDPTYKDKSWIDDYIRLLPRMHEWVDQNYPGTKISLSEYDMAFGDSTQDNLVEAETLGIFAREQLDLATLWPETDNDHYADAFKLFRNYDGSKSKFGDTYVSSQSADQSQLAVYGAQRPDGTLTLAVVNKSGSALTSNVGLANFVPAGSAQLWQWTGTATGIQRAADVTVGSGGFSASFPARSMTMVVIPPAAGTPIAGGPGPGGGSPTPTPTGSGKPGTVRCKVPKLRGLTLKKAKTKLRKAHCRVGKVTKKKSRTRKGRVIGQKPKAGSLRRNGTKVALVLSRGR